MKNKEEVSLTKTRRSYTKHIVIAIFVILVVTTAVSYSLWQINHQGEETQRISSGCFEMAFVEKTNSVNLTNTYPMIDSQGLKTNPYTFSIKNDCSIYGEYYILLDIVNSTTTIDLSKIKVSLEGAKKVAPTIINTLSPNTEELDSGIKSSYILATDSAKVSGEEKEYSFRMWIDESAGNEVANQTIEVRLTIISIAKSSPNFLHGLILAQETNTATISAKGEPDMSIAPTVETSGLYATEDEYGTSYYYRGEKDVLANNVVFAEHQWKIVRINGDGSIRLIFNGTCPNNSCMIDVGETDQAINDGATYAWNTNDLDAKYVGYMYGGADGETSTSKNQAQSNKTDSNAKTVLDAWYETNIKNTEYEKYVVDNIFCNDRSIESGLGFGVSGVTYYKAYTRLATPYPNPILKCEQKNDRFTVNDTIKGNGALTYPIGLITADEAQYAGIGYWDSDLNNYLFASQYYWTFTPYSFNNYTEIWHISASGHLRNEMVFGTLRGVVNLTSDVVISSGDGTTSNPYIIATN